MYSPVVLSKRTFMHLVLSFFILLLQSLVSNYWFSSVKIKHSAPEFNHIRAFICAHIIFQLSLYIQKSLFNILVFKNLFCRLDLLKYFYSSILVSFIFYCSYLLYCSQVHIHTHILKHTRTGRNEVFQYFYSILLH